MTAPSAGPGRSWGCWCAGSGDASAVAPSTNPSAARVGRRGRGRRLRPTRSDARLHVPERRPLRRRRRWGQGPTNIGTACCGSMCAQQATTVRTCSALSARASPPPYVTITKPRWRNRASLIPWGDRALSVATCRDVPRPSLGRCACLKRYRHPTTRSWRREPPRPGSSSSPRGLSLAGALLAVPPWPKARSSWVHMSPSPDSGSDGGSRSTGVPRWFHPRRRVNDVLGI